MLSELLFGGVIHRSIIGPTTYSSLYKGRTLLCVVPIC